MRRVIFSILALSCALSVAPPASAQQNFNHSYDLEIQNLCAPDFVEEEAYALVDQPRFVTRLDFHQLEQVRIELLERGFDPGFAPDRDNTIDEQLSSALAQFQAAWELPVSGVIDIPTLVALSFPTQQLRHDQFS
jgi:hypothetical protein